VIVVSDTTPINYLVLINAIDVLPQLFGEVYAPGEVLRELSDPKAPQGVRIWSDSPPPWLRIRNPIIQLPSTARLDPGEAAAISLAKEIGAAAVLMDENRGRKVATKEGLVAVRTLPLLEMAAEKSLIALEPALLRLSRTSFRITASLINDAINRHRARRPSQPGSERS
jgi:predicted nucleic acid-binding protein